MIIGYWFKTTVFYFLFSLWSLFVISVVLVTVITDQNSNNIDIWLYTTSQRNFKTYKNVDVGTNIY